MSIIESFKEKFTDTAKAAAKASSDFVEISKLNSSVKSLEEKIRAEKIEIANTIYKTYKDGKPVESELSIKCDSINEYEENILELKQRILDMKSKRICNICGTELDKESVYCFKCGSKL